MSDKYMDFDAAWAELKEQPAATFTVKGKIFTLPPEVPAGAILEAMAMSDKNSAVAGSSVRKMLSSLLGDEQFDALLQTGISLPKLEDILSWALAQYQGQEPEPLEKKEPEPVQNVTGEGNGNLTNSSSISDSLKPISSENIEST